MRVSLLTVEDLSARMTLTAVPCITIKPFLASIERQHVFITECVIYVLFQTELKRA
jgi:hypothetical protein